MKTLERFWHWHRHEKPDADLSGAMLDKNLSPLAQQSLIRAQEIIAVRALPKNQDDWAALMGPLEKLSLAICSTLSVIPERTYDNRTEPLRLLGDD